MNGYKKIIKSQKLRMAILNLLRFVPDKTMISIQYRIKMGRKLNLKNPERYTEKLQAYKLYHRDSLMTKCADKYRVREFIEEKGLGEILCKLYGVYDKAEDIDYDNLPDRFVMKTTNGSGTNIICKDKSKLDREDTNVKLNDWLKRDCYGLGREWAYKDIEPKIVVEEFLEDENSKFEGINDYKFLCFGGKAEYIVFDVDRFVGHKRNIYDTQWNNLNIGTDCDKIDREIEKPEGLEQMIEVANVLAKDFPCVRVDLYWVNGKVYFGELTFYPWTGYVQFDPDEFDFTMGKKFDLF